MSFCFLLNLVLASYNPILVYVNTLSPGQYLIFVFNSYNFVSGLEPSSLDKMGECCENLFLPIVSQYQSKA